MSVTPEKPAFLFAVCQAGAEPALKAELARAHPGLNPAFSRPGFVTFKAADDSLKLDAAFALRSVFARAYGLSLGKVRVDPDAPEAAVAELLTAARALTGAPSGAKAGAKPAKLRLHVWARDEHSPGEEPLGYDPGPRWTRALQLIRASKDAAKLFHQNALPERGDLVFDVVTVEENEWWFGVHRHEAGHSPYPGGKPALTLPAAAPSRAWLKIEEALLWSDAPVKKGDTAVEIGSAPGGASYALLKRGLRVVGIDPGEMDPRVLADPGFHHFKRPVATVLREELPEAVHWILLDMNVSPAVSLFAVDRLVHRTKSSLLGVFLTVKLNEWKLAAEIPAMLEHVKAMGLVRIRAGQLASNRQEITIHGLTRKGQSRSAKS